MSFTPQDAQAQFNAFKDPLAANKAAEVKAAEPVTPAAENLAVQAADDNNKVTAQPGVLDFGTSSGGMYPAQMPDKGLLLADKRNIDFGFNVKDEAVVALTLVNSGSADLTLNEIALAGGDKGVSFSADSCKKDAVLKPDDACYLVLSWRPASRASLIDTLQIKHSGARGFLLIPVTGSAGEFAISKSPAANGSGAVDWARVGNGIREIKQIKNIQDFKITSMAKDRAVINGTAGAFLVRQGEQIEIEGSLWAVKVTAEGVLLEAAQDDKKINLKFNYDLKPALGEADGEETAGAKARTAPPLITDLKMLKP